MQWGGWYINSKILSGTYSIHHREHTEDTVAWLQYHPFPLSSFFTEACSDVCLLGNVITITIPYQPIMGTGIESSWLAFRVLASDSRRFAEGFLGKVFLALNGDIQRNMPPSPWDVVASGCVPWNWNSHLGANQRPKLRTKPTHWWRQTKENELAVVESVYQSALVLPSLDFL